MIKLGIANSRMKDFHDLHSLANMFAFEGAILANAIARTFERRKTEIPIELPIAFTAAFYHDESKRKQWNAFSQRNRLYIERRELAEIVTDIAAFLIPVVESLPRAQPFNSVWSPRGPWK